MLNLLFSLNDLFNQITTDGIDVKVFSIIIISTVILSFIISLIYIKTNKRTGYTRSLPITLVIVPLIIASIILLVGTNVAGAFSLAGALSLIRFRSEQTEVRDVAFILSSVGVGFATGLGFIGYAVILGILICILMIIAEKTRFGEPGSNNLRLKIIVPEDLNYQSLFDDLLNTYTLDWHLDKVKTCDFGTMFELSFRIVIKSDCNTKSFIDELRTRNGNLAITLTNQEN